MVVRAGQHSRDKLLVEHLVNVFNCGYTFEHKTKNYIEFVVSRFEDIYIKIISFFNKYEIKGIKAFDYKDFCKIAELINKKAHLTSGGLEKIYNIKRNMNRGRY